MSAPKATHQYVAGGLEAALQFVKRTRNELRQLRRVRIWKDKFLVYDVNKDYFEVLGIGYAEPEIIPLLQQVNTSYNPETIHEPTTDDYKEFDTGRRYPWAQDRVM